jgi:predicted nicotinamide N-methyase
VQNKCLVYLLLNRDVPTNHFTVDCSVAAEKLYWGRDVESFLTQHPDKFDILIAADVIYEEDQVQPLIETVVAMLKGG